MWHTLTQCNFDHQPRINTGEYIKNQANKSKDTHNGKISFRKRQHGHWKTWSRLSDTALKNRTKTSCLSKWKPAGLACVCLPGQDHRHQPTAGLLSLALTERSGKGAEPLSPQSLLPALFLFFFLQPTLLKGKFCGSASNSLWSSLEAKTWNAWS